MKIFNILPPALAVLMLGFTAQQIMSHPKREDAIPAISPAMTDMTYRVAGVGIIEPKSRLIEIGPNIAGIITSMPVKVGDVVKKGAPLFTIDPRDTMASLETARAAQEVAQVALENAQSQLSFYLGLRDPAAISRQDLVSRQFAVKSAAASLSQAIASVNALRVALERLTVTAPMDGTVLQINTRLGEYAAFGQLQTPIMVFGDMSETYVRVEIDETDAQRIQKGQKAVGTLRGTSDTPVPLTFVYLEPLLVPKKSLTGDATELIDTRVMEVVFAFPNEKIGAYPGQEMDVFIDPATPGAPHA